MEDVLNAVRPESQQTVRSSPFRDGICLQCDLREGTWSKRGDIKRSEANREIPEVNPCYEAWVTPFSETSTGCDMSPKGLLVPNAVYHPYLQNLGDLRDIPGLLCWGFLHQCPPLASKAISSVILNPGYCTLQPVGGVLHPVSPG